MAVKDIFEAIGLGTPFIFTAATYGFFYWLDRNASAQAARAISAWLKREPYRQMDLGLALAAAFDRLYSSPLLRIRAFLRSAVLSLIVWLAYTFYYFSTDFHLIVSGRFAFSRLLVMLSSVIMSDYISLFVVRRCLLGGGKPFRLLFSALIAGAVVIAVIYFLAEHTRIGKNELVLAG